MVTAYYIMKMVKNKRIINAEEYYKNLQNKPQFAVFDKQAKCRVCLKQGDVSIFDAEDAQDVKDALKTFGEIEDFHQEEDKPKKLCSICFKFIKSAILFRLIARRTNETLKQNLPIQSLEYFQEENKQLEIFDEKTNSTLICEDLLCPKKPSKVQCHICKKMFSKCYFKVHMTLHNPKHHNQYVCDTCGKCFRLRVTYYKHSLRHATNYDFQCQICPFKARYDESLKRHMQSHIRNYKYLCTECPARFLYKSNLNYHVMVKHKEPEFKCNSCGKAFYTKLNLERHYDVEHLGIRSHVCEMCGQAYGYRKAMVKHQIRVHKREKLKLRFNNANYKGISDKE